MRYLVRGRVKSGKKKALLEAVETGALGRGSIAHDEFLRCMGEARLTPEGQVRWLEVCYCREAFGPGNELAEELPYWREYFEGIVARSLARVEPIVDWISDIEGEAGVIRLNGRTVTYADPELRVKIGIVQLKGGGASEYSGTIYGATTNLIMRGGGTGEAGSLTLQMVVQTLEFRGGSIFDFNYDEAEVARFRVYGLVE